MYFNNEDALRFYLLSKVVGEQVYTDLFNSFEKDKTKNKDKCRQLESEGLATANDIVVRVTEMLKENDLAWSEELEGLEPDEKKVLAEMFSKEALDLMKTFKKAA